MFRRPCFFILVCISFVLLSSVQLYAQDEEGDIRERERVAPQEKTLYFTLRLGQEGIILLGFTINFGL